MALEGGLAGPDSYMRLLRVTQLYESAAWFDLSIPRSNAPYGELLHWTRPADISISQAHWSYNHYSDLNVRSSCGASASPPCCTLP